VVSRGGFVRGVVGLVRGVVGWFKHRGLNACGQMVGEATRAAGNLVLGIVAPLRMRWALQFASF